MSENDFARAGRSAGRKVWILASVGLLAGVLTFSLMLWALADIRAARERADSLLQLMGGMMTDLDGQLAESREAILDVLHGMPGAHVTDGAISRELAIDTHPELLEEAHLVEPLARIDDHLRSLEGLRRDVVDWQTREADNDREVDVARGRTDEALRRIRAAIASAQGRQRLKTMMALKRVDGGQSGEGGKVPIRKLLASAAVASDLTSAQVESADLALLCEQLASEAQPDALADLKDNLLTSTLARLRQVLDRSSGGEGAAAAVSEQLVSDFETALFGHGFVNDKDHQTVIPGSDGLYSSITTRLALRQDGNDLHHREEALYAAADEAALGLARQSDGFVQQVASRAEAALTSGLTSVVVVGLLCAAVFIGLAVQIAGHVHGQVRELVSANLALDLARDEAIASARALERLTRRNELILTSAGEGIYGIDTDARITFANPTAERLLGAEHGALIGQNGGDLSPSGKGEPCAVRKVLASGRPAVSVGGAVRRKDGSVLPVEYTCTPIVDEDETVGAVVVLKDITQRKEAEEKLAEVNRQLVEASRAAGMSEIATGVLHNVGNVLNSVNVSAGVIRDIVSSSASRDLDKVAAKVDEQSDELSRAGDIGQHLPSYLTGLVEVLGTERSSTLTELRRLTDGVDHIKEIVSMQQSHARASALTESVLLTDLVEDALRMGHDSHGRHGIDIVRDFEDGIKVVTSRHQILQILVNLMSNAKHAVENLNHAKRRIAVRVARAGEHRAVIEVSDNGVGISEENLKKVFTLGFTTKKAGHGFGLHSSVLTARELGGALSVRSDGPGAGATFTLEIPLEARPAEAAA